MSLEFDDEAEGLIDILFDDKGKWGTNLAKSEDHAEWAIRAAKKFCNEQIAVRVRQSVQIHRSVLKDLPTFLETARQETEEVAAIGVSTAASLFPDGWDKEGGINMFSTGVNFLDTALKGGHAPGEVYGVLGPFASCKTTLAVMLAVEGCRHAAQLLQETGEQQCVFLASYEAGLAELRNPDPFLRREDHALVPGAHGPARSRRPLHGPSSLLLRKDDVRDRPGGGQEGSRRAGPGETGHEVAGEALDHLGHDRGR